MTELTECLNCSSIWSPGTDEYDFQRCSSCGWTLGTPLDDDDGEDFDDNEDWNEEPGFNHGKKEENIEKVDVQFLTQLVHKGARKAKAKGILKECGRMCHNCAFKENQPQQSNYLIAIAGACGQLMSGGGFHCHTPGYEDAGTECVGFKFAKLALEK